MAKSSNEFEKKDISFVLKDLESINTGRESDETKLEILIDSIENIVKDEPIQIRISIEHDDVIIGKSEFMRINSSYEDSIRAYPIDFMVEFPYTANDTKCINALVSIPVLIKVFYFTDDDIGSQKSLSRKSKGSLESNSGRSSKTGTLLGMCNIDLLPIVLGETIHNEKLIIEIPSLNHDSKCVSWKNLPRISVTIRQDGCDPIMKEPNFNVLNITVESIYNLPPFLIEEVQYKCGTILYTDRDIEESRIIFENGKWIDFRDVERTKTWKPLEYLDSRAKFSKYKVNCDYDCVKNEFKKQFDLKTVSRQNTARIEWNCMNRSFLDEDEEKNIYNRIRKYKYWPFEIEVTESLENLKPEDIQSTTGIIFQCYVDASELLFPGRSKTRVLAQLYTQNASELEEKTGLRKSVFSNPSSGESENSSHNQSDAGEEECIEEEKSIPLYTENGDPVLILIEIELYRPFKLARTLENYTEAFQILRNKPKLKKPIYSFTPDLVHEQYINCVQHLVDVIGGSYKEFSERCECQEDSVDETIEDDIKDPCKAPKQKFHNVDKVSCPYAYIPDELDRFKQFLHESGMYSSIRTKLKNKIINLMDQKFAVDSPDWCSIENQNFVASCYTYLVEEMQNAIDSKLDVRIVPETTEIECAKNLWYLAEEAYELRDYEKSEQLITRIIYKDRNNPDSWIRYAIYLMKFCNVDEAIECCREAIKLNSRHRIALLSYGVHLAMREEYSDAEIFLKAVTHFYPRFAEGWAVLHLLYVKTQYYPGIDLTLNFAEKCLKDRIRDLKNDSLDVINQEPMAWSTILCKSDRIFLLTAVLLLKLNLYDFAGLALSQEMCQNGESCTLLYFLSVANYLQGKYETVLECICRAESIIGLEYSVYSLMGHTYYKCGNIDKAIENYQSIDMMYDRPEDIHLVYLRLGFYYIDIGDYERARNVLLRDCKYKPTCRTWLGVGISSYYLEKFDESEISLSEANRIDSDDPEVWGYLCLLNMSLRRYEEFTQCYRQTVKNNLRNDKLWRLITQTMETLGYSIPTIVLEDPDRKCIC